MISEKDATATSAAADNQAGALTEQARAAVPVAQAAAVGDASAQGAKIAERGCRWVLGFCSRGRQRVWCSVYAFTHTIHAYHTRV